MTEKARLELKKAIIKWLFDNADTWNRTYGCVKYFHPYMYDGNGNWLIGGLEVYNFIMDANKLIYGKS